MQDTMSIEQTNGHDPRFYQVDSLDAYRERKMREHQEKRQRKPEYVSPINGRRIAFCDAPSPYALDDYRSEFAADHPEPQAPMIFIANDDKGGGLEEPNLDDPDYIKAHNAWSFARDKYAGDALLSEVIAFCIDPTCLPLDEIAKQKDHHTRRGHPIQMSDAEYYVKRMVIRNGEDFNGIVEACMSVLAPTQEQIQKK